MLIVLLMGRHFGFNREEALTKAMNVFWQKGFRSTSMKDLVDNMGIQPGSIYNTFGDKRTLFIEAVKHYDDVITSRMLRVLYSPGSPVTNLRAFFEQLIETPEEAKTRGCLLSNSIVEVAPHDREIAEILNKLFLKEQEAFKQCLSKAVEQGEIDKNTDIDSLSSYLVTCTHGLLVTGKSLPEKKRMKAVVDVIMSNM